MSAAERAPFHAQRLQLGLDQAVRDHLYALGVDVETTVGSWLTEEAFMAPTSIRARITDGAKPSEVEVSLQSLGPVDAIALGAPPSIKWTWSAGPSDQIFLGGLLPFSNTLFVSAFAQARAAMDFPDTTTVSGAMASLVDCETLGATLDTAASCVGCGTALCSDGLTHLWTAALAGAADSATVNVSVSAIATVDDTAAATSFAGNWVGDLSASGKKATLSGSAMGSNTIE
jgi:hypothetical protein